MEIKFEKTIVHDPNEHRRRDITSSANPEQQTKEALIKYPHIAFEDLTKEHFWEARKILMKNHTFEDNAKYNNAISEIFYFKNNWKKTDELAEKWNTWMTEERTNLCQKEIAALVINAVAEAGGPLLHREYEALKGSMPESYKIYCKGLKACIFQKEELEQLKDEIKEYAYGNHSDSFFDNESQNEDSMTDSDDNMEIDDDSDYYRNDYRDDYFNNDSSLDEIEEFNKLAEKYDQAFQQLEDLLLRKGSFSHLSDDALAKRDEYRDILLQYKQGMITEYQVLCNSLEDEIINLSFETLMNNTTAEEHTRQCKEHLRQLEKLILEQEIFKIPTHKIIKDTPIKRYTEDLIAYSLVRQVIDDKRIQALTECADYLEKIRKYNDKIKKYDEEARKRFGLRFLPDPAEPF